MIKQSVLYPSKLSRSLLYFFLPILGVIFAFPLLALAINSLQPINTTFTLFPTKFRFENFKLATELIPFKRYLLNSLIISGITVILQTFTSAIVGYAFARKKARGKNILFFIVISTIMMPGIITQIPTYILFNQFGLLNSFLPWVLWGLGGNAFFIFLYRQFFSGIPKDLEDAARIDGCSSLRILFTIFIPISIPVLITTSIMAFNSSWGGDYLTPYMFLQEDKYPLVTALIQVGYVMPDNPSIKLDQLLYAAVVMFVVPSIILFIVGQRYMVDGFVNSGIKG